MYYLGLDLGFFIENCISPTALWCGCKVKEPEERWRFLAHRRYWAEQRPEDWWSLCCRGIRRILEENAVDPDR